MKVAESITCVDCDGIAHLLTTWVTDTPPEPGDILSYLCASCWERFDLVWEDQDHDE